MNNLKRFFAIVLTICLFASSITFSFADETTQTSTKEDKAKVLNTLGIMKGTGSSFNLDGKLKRNEAAAFIVRLLGAEEKVLSNKPTYAYTSYEDVSPDEWYAPYVGYCDQEGIINGSSDSSFRPLEFVSEKEFLKMVLVALSYRYNIDFSWDSVYYTAYAKGLVKNSDYKTKEQDEKNYLRGNVAEVLYEALKLSDKDTNVLLVKKFVDTKVITEEQAILAGLMLDNVDTKIEKVIGESEREINVLFNEKVKDITLEQIKIYLTEDDEAEIEVVAVKQNKDNSFRITLDDKQVFDADYTIAITGVIDQYGNRMGSSLYYKFKGYRPSELSSDYFMISKIDQVSNNILYVYFTQPINDNALQPTHYTLLKDNRVVVEGDAATMQVNRMPSNDNAVSVYLKTYTFKEEGTFTWTIKGKMTSAYGVLLNNGSGDSLSFEASDDENEVFKLEDIETPNRYTVELVFNKILNPVIAQQVFSYYLTTEDNYPIRITKAEVKGNGERVYLTTEERMYEDDEYILMINNITDTTKQFSITEKEYDFEADFDSVKSLKISSVKVFDANTITVKFNSPLDYDTATDVNNYEIRGVSDDDYREVPVAAYYEKGNKEVILFLPEDDGLEDKDKYEVVIIGTLKDDLGNTHRGVDEEEFKHNNKDTIDTYIKDATIIGSDTIRIEFNREIALDIPNVLNTNYKLTYVDNGFEYSKIPIAAIYMTPTTMVLKFDSLEIDKEYEITFTELVNYGKIKTNNSKGKYYEDVKIGK